MAVLLVFVGGCVGAAGRFATDRFVSQRHDMVFPWGTFAVNVAGSALLGFVAGAEPTQSWVPLLVGTGFCGALTTYSTFSFETIRLLEEGSYVEAGLNIGATVAVGLSCVAGGFVLARASF